MALAGTVSGCASNAISSTPKEDFEPSCVVGLLSSGKEHLGTVFKLSLPEGPAYVTTAHSLPTSRTKEVWLTFACAGKTNRQRIVASEPLPGVDVAIIRPATPIQEMPALRPGRLQPGSFLIPSYPQMASLDPRLAGVAVEVSASYAHAAEGKLYFFAQFLRQGASGAPVVDQRQEVVGIVVGRLLEGGTYAGIGHGEAISKILAAFAARAPSQTSPSNREPPRSVQLPPARAASASDGKTD